MGDEVKKAVTQGSVLIDGTPFVVGEVEDLQDEDGTALNGRIMYDPDQVILIDANINALRKFRTLLHEIHHGIVTEGQLELDWRKHEEGAIIRLASLWSRLLLDQKTWDLLSHYREEAGKMLKEAGREMGQ